MTRWRTALGVGALAATAALAPLPAARAAPGGPGPAFASTPGSPGSPGRTLTSSPADGARGFSLTRYDTVQVLPGGKLLVGGFALLAPIGAPGGAAPAITLRPASGALATAWSRDQAPAVDTAPADATGAAEPPGCAPGDNAFDDAGADDVRLCGLDGFDDFDGFDRLGGKGGGDAADAEAEACAGRSGDKETIC